MEVQIGAQPERGAAGVLGKLEVLGQRQMIV